MSEGEFSVSQAARKVGVSTDTIRRYELLGVYKARRVLGYRVLTAENIAAIAKHHKSRRPGRPSSPRI